MENFVGIDVSKSKLDVFESAGDKAGTFANDETGIEQLVVRLHASSPTLIVIESSGGYERQVTAKLAARQLPVALVNPTQPKAFAKAIGRRAKTDALDAELLALFAQRVRPEARPLRSEAHQQLTDMLERRRQLIDMQVAEKNRHKQAQGRVKHDIEAHLHWLKQRIKEHDGELETMISTSEELNPKVVLLDKITGIGRVVAMILVAGMPELGSLSNKKITALAGLAPMNRDSGSYAGKRFIGGGREHIRKALYMAVMATRSGPIKAFRDRLKAADKHGSVAMTAAMRKLLIIANAILRDEADWDENHRAKSLVHA